MTGDETKRQHDSSAGEHPPLSAEGQRMRKLRGEEGRAMAVPLTHSPGATAAALQGFARDSLAARSWADS